MKEDLNRTLMLTLAQAATDGRVAEAERERVHARGLGVRHEALHSLLFDAPWAAPAERFSAPAAVRDAMEQCRLRLPASLAVTVEVDEGEDYLRGDQRSLNRIVILFAAQSWHAVAGEGSLAVRLDRVPKKRVPRECPDLGDGPCARLSFTSVGRRAGTSPSVLDPLFQVPRSAGGSWNLGLSLARKAAWSLGGMVCEAAEREQYDVYLPLEVTPRSSARPSLARTGGPCCPYLGLGILYVSSEEAILAMGQPSLIQPDSCVTCSGDDALRSFEARGDEIDVVVVVDEGHLGDSSAEDLVEELQRRRSDLPVLTVPGGRRLPELRDYIMTPYSAREPRAASGKPASASAGPRSKRPGEKPTIDA